MAKAKSSVKDPWESIHEKGVPGYPPITSGDGRVRGKVLGREVLGKAKSFTPPEGAKVAERSARGEPTVYEKDGERIYAPASTMYQLGYETEKEYVEAQKGRRVEVKPGKVEFEYGPKHVAVRGHTGELLHITQAQAKTLRMTKNKDQFEAMVRLGLIPRGSLYLPKTKGEWDYIPAKQVKEIEKQSPKLHKILLERGYSAYQSALVAAQFKAEVSEKERRKAEKEWEKTPVLEAKALAREAKRRRVRLEASESALETIAETKFLALEARKKEVSSRDARAWISMLVPTATEATKDATTVEKIKAIIKAEQAKVNIGTTGMSAGAENIRRKTQVYLEEKHPAIRLAGKAVVGGLVLAPAYQSIFGGSMLQTAWQKQKVQHLKDVGGGIAEYFKSIPAEFAQRPYMTTGELIGVFILGPGGVFRMIKSTGARLSPHYIPKRGMAIEYSVTKVPANKLGKAVTTKAVNNALRQALKDPKGEATVPIGKGNLRLRLKPTPVSQTVGPALYHATPEISPALLKGKVKGELFTSPQAAPRFADSSAAGVAMAKPAIVMIFTKEKGVKWHPTYNLYRGTKEIEAIYPSGTKLSRTKTFRSRLFGAKAGDFITTHNGNIIPIYRFAEKGAKVPAFSPAELAAIRIRAIKATLADLAKGRKGYEIIKVESLKELTTKVVKETEKEVKKGVRYDRALDRVTRRELGELYRMNPRLFERIYRGSPERFEGRYLERLGRELDELRRAPIRERRYVPPALPPEREGMPPPERREEIPPPEERRGVPPPEREEAPPPERRKPPPPERDRVPPPERARVPPPPEERLRVPPPPREEVPPPPPPTKIIRDRGDGKRKWTEEEIKGAIAWKQGFMVYGVRAPYQSDADVKRWHVKKAPKGLKLTKGPGSAYKTIQTVTGKAPKELFLDMGIQDVKITGPSTGIYRTKRPKIKFSRDIRQATRGDINLRRHGGLPSVRLKGVRSRRPIYQTGNLLSRRPLGKRGRNSGIYRPGTSMHFG